MKAFDHLTVEGGTEDHKTIFYSALYRSLLFPMTFADVDGSYPGGDHQVHQSNAFVNRTLFSGWGQLPERLSLAEPGGAIGVE